MYKTKSAANDDFKKQWVIFLQPWPICLGINNHKYFLGQLPQTFVSKMVAQKLVNSISLELSLLVFF